MNVKELHKLLISWGLFWAEKETLQGYASKSVTEKCCEVMRTGIWVSSDSHLFSYGADSVYVPEWVSALDKCVATLPQAQRLVLNRCYIKKHNLSTSEKLALWHAHAAILSGY